MNKFAIIISTYKKPDGRTPELLTKTLQSVIDQTYTNWKVFLIGDKYEDDDEFKKLASIIPTDKIKCVNRLDAIVERDTYPMPSQPLWCAGGGSSNRFGIDLALKEGYDFICYLNHDDWWDRNHLGNFNSVLLEHPDLFFLASRSHFRRVNNILPPHNQKAGIGYYPIPCRVVTSSTCIKFSETSVRSRDVFKETGRAVPGDMDLWRRLSQFMKDNNKLGFLVNEITCYHLEEGSARKG